VTPQGWSVISDIDDTIKDSNVLDKKELMRNTLLREFKPVTGMSKVYADWARGGAAFHYVSGSPWQLYPPLGEFCTKNGFPSGSFQLRYFRLQDGSALSLLQAPDQYKQGAIAELLKTFPQRKFILVGDTGEKDPEVYGEAARKHPGRVHLIAVRNVTKETLEGARLQAAFAGLPPASLLLFDEAGQLPNLDAVGK
jgi:phosphatidate phosphatase APP1